MPTFQDHNRRTPAANADVLGDDADLAVSDAGTVEVPPVATRPPASPGDTLAQPGVEIKEAGFVRDRDTERP